MNIQKLGAAAALICISIGFSAQSYGFPIKIPGISKGEKSKQADSNPVSNKLPSKEKKIVQDLYASLDFKCCQEQRPDQIFEAAGLPFGYNPVRTMDSPDAEWIPGWGSITLTDIAYEAIIQAAMNKTWTQQCHADYTDYRTQWDAINTEIKPKIAALQDKDYYTRVQGLTKLLSEIEKRANAEQLQLKPEHPIQGSGIRYEIIREIIQANRDAKREFALWGVLQPFEAQYTPAWSNGRSWTTDLTLEQNIFCSYGQASGTHRTGPMPTPYSSRVGEYIRWPLTNEEVGTVDGFVKAASAKSIAELQIAGAKLPNYSNGEISFDPSFPELYRFAYSITDGSVKVTSAEKKGEGWQFQMERKKSEAYNYNCKATQEIESIDPGTGMVRYRQNCDTGTQERIDALTVTFADIPDFVGSMVQIGDSITFYGKVISEKTKETKATAQVSKRNEIVIDGVHLESIVRKETTVARF